MKTIALYIVDGGLFFTFILLIKLTIWYLRNIIANDTVDRIRTKWIDSGDYLRLSKYSYGGMFDTCSKSSTVLSSEDFKNTSTLVFFIKRRNESFDSFICDSKYDIQKKDEKDIVESKYANNEIIKNICNNVAKNIPDSSKIEQINIDINYNVI